MTISSPKQPWDKLPLYQLHGGNDLGVRNFTIHENVEPITVIPIRNDDGNLILATRPVGDDEDFGSVPQLAAITAKDYPNTISLMIITPNSNSSASDVQGCPTDFDCTTDGWDLDDSDDQDDQDDDDDSDEDGNDNMKRDGNDDNGDDSGNDSDDDGDSDNDSDNDTDNNTDDNTDDNTDNNTDDNSHNTTTTPQADIKRESTQDASKDNNDQQLVYLNFDGNWTIYKAPPNGWKAFWSGAGGIQSNEQGGTFTLSLAPYVKNQSFPQ